ncbi:transporter substrate-binding domain-containing protein [Enterocloster sp. OA13]|uniref:transporter substrate-binding domain-containing protein n=1 Tax=Enterocloster TaxID=2719313 RepID=UPI0004711941|nr:transporter substrate-binding domain-containing protein [Lachnoclostridium pacaense]MCC2818239.1 transporter substrate-binding domain-containing protein [Lachnoclostridium pacaense]MCH1949594.1 transporter substrate-binding domain-containing protein [Enterocloster sp. OA13]
MKKIMALSMAAVMALSMAGCGSKPAADTAAATEASADTTAAQAEDTTAAESEAAASAAGKKYVINTDTTFAPFEFENDKGEMVGIDLDILKAVAEDQGFEYEVIPVGFSAAVTALEAGECDGVIAGMSITDERAAKYDFSEPYYDSGVGMAVLQGSDITSYDQLKGQNVAAKIGTEGCTFAESIADQYGFEVTQFESSSDMYQAVLGGEAVACFEDYPVIGYEISRGLGLTLPTPMEKGSSYGFATLKGANPELVEMFNKGLENIKASGKYDEILSTYIAK